MAVTERVIQATPATPALPGAGILATPFQFVLSGTENLQVVSANSLAGCVITIQGRLLLPSGSIQPFSFQHTPNIDRSQKVEHFALGGGTLLTVVAFASSGTPVRGQTFVQITVIQGLTGASIVLGTLLQGYVTSVEQLAWPGSPIQSSLSGRGWLHQVSLTTPGAGVPNAFVVAPTRARWRVQNVTTNFTTDGTAGNRFILLFFDVLGVQVQHLPLNNNIGPGANVLCSWTAGAGAGFVVDPSTGLAFASLAIGPGVELAGGDDIGLALLNIKPADNLVAQVAIVEEWLDLH